jgi:hypothetical protein
MVRDEFPAGAQATAFSQSGFALLTQPYKVTPSLAKEGVSGAPARATPIAYLQELFE